MKLKYETIKLFLNSLIAICQSLSVKNRKDFEEDIYYLIFLIPKPYVIKYSCS